MPKLTPFSGQTDEEMAAAAGASLRPFDGLTDEELAAQAGQSRPGDGKSVTLGDLAHDLNPAKVAWNGATSAAKGLGQGMQWLASQIVEGGARALGMDEQADAYARAAAAQHQAILDDQERLIPQVDNRTYGGEMADALAQYLIPGSIGAKGVSLAANAARAASGSGRLAARMARVAGPATETAPGALTRFLPGAIGGAAGDWFAADETKPEMNQSLGNLVEHLTGVPVPTAVEATDSPGLMRAKIAGEGAVLGGLIHGGIGLMRARRAANAAGDAAPAADAAPTPAGADEAAVPPAQPAPGVFRIGPEERAAAQARLDAKAAAEAEDAARIRRLTGPDPLTALPAPGGRAVVVRPEPGVPAAPAAPEPGPRALPAPETPPALPRPEETRLLAGPDAAEGDGFVMGASKQGTPEEWARAVVDGTPVGKSVSIKALESAGVPRASARAILERLAEQGHVERTERGAWKRTRSPDVQETYAPGYRHGEGQEPAPVQGEPKRDPQPAPEPSVPATNADYANPNSGLLDRSSGMDDQVRAPEQRAESVWEKADGVTAPERQQANPDPAAVPTTEPTAAELKAAWDKVHGEFLQIQARSGGKLTDEGTAAASRSISARAAYYGRLQREAEAVRPDISLGKSYELRNALFLGDVAVDGDHLVARTARGQKVLDAHPSAEPVRADSGPSAARINVAQATAKDGSRGVRYQGRVYSESMIKAGKDAKGRAVPLDARRGFDQEYGTAHAPSGEPEASLADTVKSFVKDEQGGLDLGRLGELAGGLLPKSLRDRLRGSSTLTDEIDRIADEEARAARGKPAGSAIATMRTLFRSNTAALRSYADETGSEALREIADAFDYAPGRIDGKTRGQTIPERIGEINGTYNNLLGEVMADLGKAESKDPQVWQRIRSLVADRTAIDATKGIEHRVAQRIANALDELHILQRQAGVEIGLVHDYFPRVFDEAKVLAGRDNFVRRAAEAYRAADAELTAESALAKATALYEHVRLGQVGMEASEHGIKPAYAKFGFTDATKQRTFGREADRLLADFYEDGVVDTLSGYINAAARRIAWAERFGADSAKYEALLAKIDKEGHTAALGYVNTHVRSSMGLLNGGSKEMRAVSSAITAWNSLALLDGATISSLIEPMHVGLRTGNFLDGFRATYQAISRTLLKRDPTYAHDLAEYIGIMHRPEMGAILGNRLADGVGGIKSLNSATHKFFEATMLGRLTRESRVAAVDAGIRFLGRMSERILEGRDAKFVSGFFKELGVPPEQAAEFARWIKANGGKPALETLDVSGRDSMAKLYRVALRRFTDGVIIDANPANRPAWANHPLGRILYGITSYSYGFYDNVVRRMGAMAKRGLTEQGLDMSQRLQLLAPLAGLVPVAAMASGLTAARGAALNPSYQSQKSDLVKGIEVASRMSLMNPMLDRLVNYATSAKYGSSLTKALLGPGAGQLDKLGAVGQATSDLVNKGEVSNASARKVAGALYDTVLSPAANIGLSRFPVPGLATAFAIPAAGSSRASEAFTDILAPKESAGQGSGRRRARRERRGR